jgi:hypothetical protein
LRGARIGGGNGQTGNRGSQKLSSFHVSPPEGIVILDLLATTAARERL